MIGDTARQAVSVHTVTGEKVDDLPPSVLPSLMWSRERNEVSRCEFSLHNAASDVAGELIPWHHWATVWEGQKPVWTGPIQRSSSGRVLTQVSARDTATFAWRTRVPVTKTWVGLDPSSIANEIYLRMLEIHRVRATPRILPDDLADTFNFSVQADSRMVNQVMDDLTKIGLDWCVVAGVPVFGPPPSNPIATLYEADFMAEIEIVRDGVGTFNDVRLQGMNFAATSRQPLAGLNLQTLISLDDMFGVSNIQKATEQYARQKALIKDMLVVPSGASLHPEADVSLEDLVPGAVFLVQARGVENLMRLDSVEVETTAGSFNVAVTLETILDQSELDLLGGTS